MAKLIDLLEARIKELIDLNIRFNNFEKKRVRYLGFSFRKKLTYWNVGKYIQKVEIPGLKIISKMKGTLNEKIKLALEDDVRVFCNCPDFLYGGFKYIGTQLKYGTDKEHRPPVIRNPQEEGTVCKHINYLLLNIDNYVDKIEEDYKKGSKDRKTVLHDKSLEQKIKLMGLKKVKK